jgi:hypothetical protein
MKFEVVKALLSKFTQSIENSSRSSLSPILQAVVVDRPSGYFATTIILASPLTMVQPIDGTLDDDLLAVEANCPIAPRV